MGSNLQSNIEFANGRVQNQSWWGIYPLSTKPRDGHQVGHKQWDVILHIDPHDKVEFAIVNQFQSI